MADPSPNALFPETPTGERYQVKMRYDWQGEYFEVVDAQDHERTVHQFRTRRRAEEVAEIFNQEHQARLRG
jgi:hypothetical protein